MMTENELAAAKAQCEEYLNGWKRAKADFINYQKDETKRFEQILRFGNESLLKELLIVLDSFALALAAHPAEKGFFIVQSQLEDILKKNGLEKLIIAIGQPFDPALHEAVAETASQEFSSGTVVEEVEKGYTLHGKLIRPARVKVAK